MTQPLTVPTRLTVNGRERRLDLDPRVTILDALRDHLGVTSVKKGCDHGQCGACTVLVDGRRVLSCLSLAASHDGADVTTAEGLGTVDALGDLQEAFVEFDALQCGYCTPGQICSAEGMLAPSQGGASGGGGTAVQRQTAAAPAEMTPAQVQSALT